MDEDEIDLGHRLKTLDNWSKLDELRASPGDDHQSSRSVPPEYPRGPAINRTCTNLLARWKFLEFNLQSRQAYVY